VAILGDRKAQQALRQHGADPPRTSNKASASANFGPRQRPPAAKDGVFNPLNLRADDPRLRSIRLQWRRNAPDSALRPHRTLQIEPSRFTLLEIAVDSALSGCRVRAISDHKDAEGLAPNCVDALLLTAHLPHHRFCA
jgi:hypothetical protein